MVFKCASLTTERVSVPVFVQHYIYTKLLNIRLVCFARGSSDFVVHYIPELFHEFLFEEF